MSDGCGRDVRDVRGRDGGGGEGAWRGWFLGGSSIFLLCGGCRNTWWRLGGVLLRWEMVLVVCVGGSMSVVVMLF